MKLRMALYALIMSASLARAGEPDSLESLVKQVLAGLETRDEKALHELVITEAEFKKYVWPYLQGNLNSIGHVKADQYFKTYAKASDAGLADRLKALGGQKWELLKVGFGSERKGKGHRLLSKTEAVLRNVSGEQETFLIAGTVLDEGGKYKIATYWMRESSVIK